MPITLGILAQSRQAAPAGPSFDLLESTVLTSTQASVEFTNLATNYAATYKHLQIRMSVVMASGNYISTRYNGVTSGYRFHTLLGDGLSVSSFSDTGSSISSFTGYSDRPAGGVIDILDPFNSNKNTTQRTLGGAAANYVSLSSGLFNSTAAVTSITLLEFYGGSFASGSRFSLYGIKGA